MIKTNCILNTEKKIKKNLSLGTSFKFKHPKGISLDVTMQYLFTGKDSQK